MKEEVIQDPNNGFLTSLPQEIRDEILQQVVGEYREYGNDDEETFTINTDRKFLPRIFRICHQLTQEALQVFMRKNNFILRSGRAMKFFQRIHQGSQGSGVCSIPGFSVISLV